MSKKLTIDQKLMQVHLILLGNLEGDSTNKDAWLAIEKLANGEKLTK